MRYIKELDVLRAFAVGFVIVTHWGPHTINSSKALTFFFTRILPDGEFGVDLFFVLSGFLITGILLKAREESSDDPGMQTIGAFYIRRILRIFPAYLLLLAVMYAAGDASVREHAAYFLTYTSNMLVFRQRSWSGVSHTWSLAVEEQFYLVWPWIILFTPARSLKAVIISFLCLGSLSAVILGYLYGPFFHVLLLPCITAFAAGAYFAYARTVPARQRRLSTAIRFLLPVCVVLYFLHQFGMQFFLKRAVNAALSLSLIMYVVNGRYNRVSRYLLKNRLLASLGKVSYGIYLYHYVVPGLYRRLIDHLSLNKELSFAVHQRLKEPPLAYMICCAITVLAAYLSYYLMETRIIELKERFPYVSSARNTANG